jgi:hypothetical protein
MSEEDAKVCPYNVFGGGTLCRSGYPSQIYAPTVQKHHICRAWKFCGFDCAIGGATADCVHPEEEFSCEKCDMWAETGYCKRLDPSTGDEK